MNKFKCKTNQKGLGKGRVMMSKHHTLRGEGMGLRADHAIIAQLGQDKLRQEAFLSSVKIKRPRPTISTFSRVGHGRTW